LTAVPRRASEKISRAGLTALAALALLIAGCGSASGAGSGTPTATDTADAGGTAHVFMKVLEFTPATIRAKVGQTVTWTNADTSPHNVTYLSGPRFRSSRRVLNPGAKFSITLGQPGTIHYECTIHPWMKGTIIVSP
jgi:plastocyanin